LYNVLEQIYDIDNLMFANKANKNSFKINLKTLDFLLEYFMRILKYALKYFKKSLFFIKIMLIFTP